MGDIYYGDIFMDDLNYEYRIVSIGENIFAKLQKYGGRLLSEGEWRHDLNLNMSFGWIHVYTFADELLFKRIKK